MMLKINLLDMDIHGNVSGVDNKKFGGKRATPMAVEEIARANFVDTPEGREVVYEKLRPEIQQKFKLVVISETTRTEILYFRDAQIEISRILRAFFLDPIHLSNQFHWLTNTRDLTDIIKENMKTQIGSD